MTLVAIDGPGGSGKSTVAAALAERLGWERLDTGAMYRAVALLALERGIGPADAPALTALAGAMELEVGARVLLDGRDVTAEIRSDDVNAIVSEVATHPAVRAELVARQRAWAAAHARGVVEGRDIGSVVLPDAALKVYLDAHPEIRAQRRGGQGEVPAEGAASLAARDHVDSTRTASPLTVVDGALVIDSSHLGVDEVVERILAALAEQGIVPATPPAPAVPPAPGAPATAGDDGSPAAVASAAPRRGGARLPTTPRPPSPGELAFYAACRAIAVGTSLAYFPGPVLGAEKLPAGPFVLAPSHRSYVDWLIAARVTHRRLRYLVKAEVWRSRAAGRLLEALGAFPIARGTADRQAFQRALEVLATGEPLVVFPEGTRKNGPLIGELQEGAAYLALRAGVPVVPVALGGTEKAMPRGSVVPRPTRVRIVVGDPIAPDEFLVGAPAGRVPRTATRALSERLRKALQELFDTAEGRAGDAVAEGGAAGR